MKGRQFVLAKTSLLFPSFTRIKVAKLLGVEPKQVRRWENGQHTPRPKVLLKMSGKFGIPSDELQRRFQSIQKKPLSGMSLIIPGMMRTKVAARLKVSQKTVAAWERGRKIPWWNTIAKMNEEFAVDVEQIVHNLEAIQIISGHGREVPYRVLCRCVGYTRYGGATVFHAAKCPDEVRIRDWEIRHRKRGWTSTSRKFLSQEEADKAEFEWKDKYTGYKVILVPYQAGFFDKERMTFRCKCCAMASLQNSKLDYEASGILGEFPRSIEAQKKALSDPDFDCFLRRRKTLDTKSAKEMRAKVKSGPRKPRAVLNTRIGKIVDAWENKIPKHHVTRCRRCRYIVMSPQRAPVEFCRTCNKSVDQPPPVKKGQYQNDEEVLKKYMQWTVLHFLGNKSYREIAGHNTCDAKNVRIKTDFILKWLDTEKLRHRRFLTMAGLILKAASRQ